MRLIAGTTLLWLCAASFSPALAQQFNSDNYLSKPHGVATVGAFSYSTRLAWYPKDPRLALVAEAYGAEGAATLSPEYRAGLRWEPTAWANIAFTHGGKFDGSHASGFEIGVMLFSPPFACIGPCR